LVKTRFSIRVQRFYVNDQLTGFGPTVALHLKGKDGVPDGL